MTWLIVFCSLVFVLGVILGTVAGITLGVRHEVANRREQVQEARAVAWTRQLRAVRRPTSHFGAEDEEWEHEGLASEWHDHPPLKWDDEAVPGCPSCERRWEVHVGQALALTRPGQAAAVFDVEAETARYAAVADEIIAWVRAASEPWIGP